MKADYEPWWQFEEWQKCIVDVYEYKNKESFEKGLQNILENFRKLYEFEACRDEVYYAFWNKDEIMYCEGCDEDTQVYHGLVIERD